MPRPARHIARLLVAVALPFTFALPLAAEETAKSTAAAPAAATPTTGSTVTGTTAPADKTVGEKVTVRTPEIELTAEEKAEKESRKACKADICSAFRAKQTGGGDIACNVVKSWRKEQLGKLVGKLKVSWPYGAVRCTSDVKLKRADIVKAMTDDKLDILLEKHSVACVVEREKDTPSNINFDFAPKVSFEKGKATKAKINWGKIEAPTLIKGALWTATAADNTVNILSSTLVEDINDFVGKKCDEVKDEWAGK